MNGLFHGKSHLEMDDLEVPIGTPISNYFRTPPQKQRTCKFDDYHPELGNPFKKHLRKHRCQNTPNGGFHKWGYPKIDGLYGKTLLKWMTWRYPHSPNDVVDDWNS